MHRPTRPRHWITWLTLWALVWGACLPTVSQAVVHSTDRSQWVEVCTSTGMVWVQADDSGSPTADHAGCIWCLLAHGGLATPHPPSLPDLLPLGSHARPACPLAALSIARAWPPAQARAPPVVA